MPKGTAIYEDGSIEYYDDVVHKGDMTIIKTSYDHKVKTIKFGTAKFKPREWHRIPWGSCKSLSDHEINLATGHND